MNSWKEGAAPCKKELKGGSMAMEEKDEVNLCLPPSFCRGFNGHALRS